MKIRRRKVASGTLHSAATVPAPEAHHPESSPRGDAAASVSAFLNHAPRVGAVAPKKRGDLELAIADAERRAASGEWEEATGRSFVGLYALCHRIVYGVLPEDLAEKGALGLAAKMANTCLHTSFGDDRSAFVEFIKWTWDREKSRELWRLQNGKQGGRIGIRLQFSGSLITDHRVDLARRKKGRRG